MEDLSPPPALGAARNENKKCRKICPPRADSDAMASCPATVGQAAPVWPPLSPASLPPSPHATSSGACRCPPKSTDRSRLPPRAQCSGSNLLSWAMAARVREELMLAGRTARSSISTPERGELQSHWVPPALRRKPDSVPSSSADVTLLAAKMLSREREQSHVVA